MESAGEGKLPPRWIKICAAILLPLGLLLTYGSTLASMWSQWFPAWRQTQLGLLGRVLEGDSYYTHAPLVPAISLLMVIMLIRHVSVELRPSPKLGIVVLGASLLVHLAGLYTQLTLLSGIALILSLSGLVLLAWGARAMKILWFPLAFLIFMVPLPDVSLGQLNFQLKMLSTDWAVRLANATGVTAAREGNRILLPNGEPLIVANICNGLRCLISVVAFGALFAFLCRLRGLWRPVLFLATIPVAFVSNAIRIAATIWVAETWGVASAVGAFHAVSGLLTYLAAFMLMFALEHLMLWPRRLKFLRTRALPPLPKPRKKLRDLHQWPALRHALLSPATTASACALMAFAGMANWLGLFHQPPRARLGSSSLPRHIEIEGRQIPGQDLTLDEHTLNALDKPAYLYRRYSAGPAAPLDLCIIVSKDRPCPIPPDLRAEEDGNDIVARGNLTVHTESPSPLPCREMVLQTPRGLQYLLYTYKCGQAYTQSFWKQQALTFLDAATTGSVDCVLVRISTPIGDSLSEARQRSVILLQQAAACLDREFH